MTRIFVFVSMFAVIFVSPVSGVQVTFTRNKVIMGAAGETVLTCSVDETDIRDIFLIQVSVYSKLFPTGKSIALVDRSGLDDATNASLGDLANRIQISGSIAANLRDSRITVTFDTEKLQCADVAIYECIINYLNNAVKPISVTRSVNTSLEVYEYPVMGKLIVKHNGVEINEGTSSRNPSFKVGDQIELLCTANVGSINTTLIQWRRTTEIGNEDIWNEYQPSASASSDGQAVRENCGYTRTATMLYNLTNADANRHLGFDCYVRVSDPIYNNYVTPESLNPKFYADVSCDEGYYGIGCNTKCGYCLNNVTCMTINGSCPGGCAAGYYTDLCNQVCDFGNYGPNCVSVCGACDVVTNCHIETGKCSNGCLPGRLGIFCKDPCPEGYYGPSCYLECGHCKDDRPCEPQTGHCELCAKGYTGEFCKTICPEGRYGEGCLHSCGYCADRTPCNKTTGVCPAGCTSEYTGSHCIEATSTPTRLSLSAGAIVGIVVGVIVVIATVIIIAIFYKRRAVNKDADNTYTKPSVSATRSDSDVYDIIVNNT